MEAVAARDEIAHDVVAAAAMGIAHDRMRSVGSVDDDVGRLVHQFSARGAAGLDEILGDLRLPVDGNALAGQAAQIDPDAAMCEPQGEAVMDHAFSQHAFARPRLEQ